MPGLNTPVTLDVQLASIIGEMDAAGLYHGDLSPGNILPQDAMLIDFQTLSSPVRHVSYRAVQEGLCTCIQTLS